MHPTFSHDSNPMHVARTAQQMARNAGQDRMALAFQSVALVSMALMGTAAAAILRDLNRRELGRGR